MDRKRYASHRSNKKSRKLIILLLVAALSLAAVAIIAVANIPKDITILDGTTSLKVTTAEKDPKKIIEQNGFTLGAYDVLDDSQMEKENAVLIIKREMSVVFREGTSAWKVTLPARTVGDVLTYLGKDLADGSAVEPAEFEILHTGDTVTYFKSGTGTLEADGKTITIHTSNKTVKQLLAENGIVLSAEDEVTPAPGTVLKNGESICVTRVKTVQRTVKETVAFKTIKKQDASLGAGSRKVLKKGKNGQSSITYAIRYENGKAVKKEKLAEIVLNEPVNQVVAVGTAVSSAAKKGETKTAISGEFRYTKKYTGIATAYYEPPGNLTASGMTVGVGRIGVNPKVIPYGTKLYVTGYGYCVAADCGWGTIGMGRIADLYMNSEAECEQWGVREVTIYVLA